MTYKNCSFIWKNLEIKLFYLKCDSFIEYIKFEAEKFYFLYFSGSVHPTLTVAHTSYSCHDVLEKKSTESSPSHSQMSRNSSRKSNNSLLVNNGKYEGEYSKFPLIISLYPCTEKNVCWN